jgi:hypothetical protein
MSPRALSGYWVFFVLLPILLLWRGVQSFQEKMVEARLQAALDNANNQFRILVSQGSPDGYARAFFRRRASRDFLGPRRRLTVTPSLPAAHPTLREVAAFLDGTLIPGTRQALAWNDSLGTRFQPNEVKKHPNTPFPIRWENQDSFFIWRKLRSSTDSPATAGVHLEILVPPEPCRLFTFLLRQRQRLYGFGGCFIDRSNRSWIGTRHLLTTAMRRQYSASANRAELRHVHADRLAILKHFPQGMSLYLEFPRPTNTMPLSENHRLAGLLLTLILGTGLFWRLSGRIQGFSLAHKLTLFILVLLITPLYGLALLAFHVGDDQTQVLRSELMQRARQLLLNYDQGFRAAEAMAQRSFQRLTSMPEFTSSDPREFLNRVHSLRDQGLFSLAIGTDRHGRLLHETHTGIPDEGARRLTQLMAAKAIFQQTGKFPDDTSPRNYDLALQMLQNPLVGITSLEEVPNTLFRLSMGTQTLYPFWKTNSFKSPSPIAFFVFLTFHDLLSRDYFRKTLIANREFRIVVRERRKQVWHPYPLNHPLLETLCQEAARSGESATSHLLIGRKPFMALCLAGNLLANHDLVALIPEDLITREQQRFRRLIYGGFLLTFGLAGAMVFLLSRGLLEPLQEISTGIEAIRRHKTTYRITPTADDELGRLTHAFNHLLETVGELDHAKIIQETLLPQTLPEIPGYRLKAKCHMLGSLGGDYLDVHVVLPDRVVVMVGDVMGHGVDAALLMAMAKSLVSLHFLENQPPETLLDRLNSALFALKFSRQMMTFALVIVDNTTHAAVTLSAGNPFPCHYQSMHETSIFRGSARYPLGSRRSQCFQPLGFSLDPGDLVFLFTDGLIEALNAQQQPFGYDRIERLLAKNHTQGAESFQTLLETEFSRHVAGGAVTDDHSYIILERRKAAPPEEVSA